MYIISHKRYALLLFLSNFLYADLPFSVTGFINLDNAFDTRQVNADREGHAVLWPEPINRDATGVDINEKGQFSMIPLYARARLYADQPQLSESLYHHLVVEADFRGTSTENASLLRLRKAYGDFDWGHTAVRVGKAWHPMYVPDCAPNLVTYDDGEPPDTQVRAPQIRVTHRFAPDAEASCHELIAMAGSRTVGSLGIGPLEDGVPGQRSSTDFLRRGVAPNVHLQYRRLFDDHVVGFGVDHSRIIPRLVSEENFRDYESLGSTCFIAYAAFNFPNWVMRNKLLYTENASAYESPYGFVVVSRDPNTDRRTYDNLRAIGYWIDMDVLTDQCLQPGFFIGVQKALGTSDAIPESARDENGDLITFADRPDLDFLLKAAIRARWIQDPIEIGTEIEVAHGSFAVPVDGRTFDNHAKALKTEDATNVRMVANIFYYF